MEFDVEAITNPSGLRIRVMEEDTSPIYIRQFNQLDVTADSHVQINVDSTGCEFIVDGVSKYTNTGVGVNPFGVALICLANNTVSITVKNVKAYAV